ncbi:hypothetical protein B0H16DRAFT_1767214 [Mycena metata]|uniref:Uncharacterized protein n=1 Tax=Mycena metata TaxID=1033252 RepID=A0AAD7MWY8_9AGAR|nr:hypothetical protein B0H16DRAFT_1767214 [Mycena metata]
MELPLLIGGCAVHWLVKTRKSSNHPRLKNTSAQRFIVAQTSKLPQVSLAAADVQSPIYQMSRLHRGGATSQRHGHSVRLLLLRNAYPVASHTLPDWISPSRIHHNERYWQRKEVRPQQLVELSTSNLVTVVYPKHRFAVYVPKFQLLLKLKWCFSRSQNIFPLVQMKIAATSYAYPFPKVLSRNRHHHSIDSPGAKQETVHCLSVHRNDLALYMACLPDSLSIRRFDDNSTSIDTANLFHVAVEGRPRPHHRPPCAVLELIVARHIDTHPRARGASSRRSASFNLYLPAQDPSPPYIIHPRYCARDLADSLSLSLADSSRLTASSTKNAQLKRRKHFAVDFADLEAQGLSGLAVTKIQQGDDEGMLDLVVVDRNKNDARVLGCTTITDWSCNPGLFRPGFDIISGATFFIYFTLTWDELCGCPALVAHVSDAPRGDCSLHASLRTGVIRGRAGSGGTASLAFLYCLSLPLLGGFDGGKGRRVVSSSRRAVEGRIRASVDCPPMSSRIGDTSEYPKHHTILTYSDDTDLPERVTHALSALGSNARNARRALSAARTSAARAMATTAPMKVRRRRFPPHLRLWLRIPRRTGVHRQSAPAMPIGEALECPPNGAKPAAAPKSPTKLLAKGKSFATNNAASDEELDSDEGSEDYDGYFSDNDYAIPNNSKVRTTAAATKERVTAHIQRDFVEVVSSSYRPGLIPFTSDNELRITRGFPGTTGTSAKSFLAGAVAPPIAISDAGSGSSASRPENWINYIKYATKEPAPALPTALPARRSCPPSPPALTACPRRPPSPPAVPACSLPCHSKAM